MPLSDTSKTKKANRLYKPLRFRRAIIQSVSRLSDRFSLRDQDTEDLFAARSIAVSYE